MFSEFKKFLIQGNIVDLALAYPMPIEPNQKQPHQKLDH